MKPIHELFRQTMSARTSQLKTAFCRQPDPIRLLTCWAMLGIALGTMLRNAVPACADHFLLTQGLMLSDAERSLGDVLRTALCPLLILLTGIWLSGFSAFGQIPALLILLSRGIAFGIAAAPAELDPPDRLSTMLACLLLALLAGGMHTMLLWLLNDRLLN